MTLATQSPMVTINPTQGHAHAHVHAHELLTAPTSYAGYPATTSPGSPGVARWPLSVDDYHRLSDLGVFAHDEGIELIEGDVFVMSPPRSRHAACVSPAR